MPRANYPKLTVAQLIRMLQRMPPEAEVRIVIPEATEDSYRHPMSPSIRDGVVEL